MTAEVMDALDTGSTQQNKFIIGFLIPYRSQLEDFYSLDAEISMKGLIGKVQVLPRSY